MVATPPAQPFSCTRRALALAGLTLLALLLRLLGRGLESIWYDEAASLVVAGYPTWDLLTGRQYDPGNPAGYFLLLRGWMALWGSSGIESARALSALAGALSVPAVWALARSIGATSRATWLACALVALSPPLVYLGQEARVFALLATVTTLAAAAAARIEESDSPAAWLGFAGAGAVLVHLHYYAFFILVTLGLDLLLWAWPRGWRAVLKLVGASSLVALAFAPYLPTLLQQLSLGASRSSETWWQHLAMLPFSSLVGRTLVWKDPGQGGKLTVALVALFVLAAVFLPLVWFLLRARIRPRPVLALVLGVPLLVGCLALAGKPMIHTHYLSAVFPALLLLVAQGLDAGLSARSRLAWVPLACLLVLVPAALVRTYTVRHKNDWRSLAAHVEKEAGDLPAYFYEDIGSAPFAYYRPDLPERLVTKRFGSEGEGWEKAGTAGQMRREREGFWLIFYPTNSSSRAEEEGIVRWLGREWDIQDDTVFPPMRALRCVPRNPATASLRPEDASR